MPEAGLAGIVNKTSFSLISLVGSILAAIAIGWFLLHLVHIVRRNLPDWYFSGIENLAPHGGCPRVLSWLLAAVAFSSSRVAFELIAYEIVAKTLTEWQDDLRAGRRGRAMCTISRCYCHIFLNVSLYFISTVGSVAPAVSHAWRLAKLVAIITILVSIIAGVPVTEVAADILQKLENAWRAITPIPSTDTFDSTTGRWKQRNLPPEITRRAYAWIDGELYLFGGTDGPNTVDKVDIYNPSLDQWRLGRNMLTARYGAAAVQAKERIYVIGGGTHDRPSTGINESYDPVTNKWMTHPSMPHDRVGHAAAVVYGRIYAFGGNSGFEIYKTIDVFDPIVGVWTTLSREMPKPRTGSAAVVVGTKVILLGGYNYEDGVLSDVDLFDVVTQSWSKLPSLPTPRRNLVAFLMDNTVYAIDGQINDRIHVLESYTLPDGYAIDASDSRYNANVSEIRVLQGESVNAGSRQTSAPRIAQLSLDRSPGEYQSFIVQGTGFDRESVVTIDGISLTTTFLASSSLEAILPRAVLRTLKGTVGVTVTNGSGTVSPVTELHVVERGDLNGNDAVNIGDALTTALMVGGVRKPPLTPQVGDVNLSGGVNIGDALVMALFAGRVAPDFIAAAIRSVEPVVAKRNAELTLNGTGLSAKPNDLEVLFPSLNGVTRVPVSRSTATSLTVTVPDVAVSGPIQVLREDLQVLSNEFPLEISGTLPGRIFVASISPFYKVSSGDVITINGMGFDPILSNNIVLFSGQVEPIKVAALALAADSTSLMVPVPRSAVSGNVSVTVRGKTSNARPIVIAGTPVPLMLTDIQGISTAGETIILEGLGFDVANPANDIVRFTSSNGSVDAKVILAGATQLHVVVPDNAIEGTVTVTVANTQSNALAFKPSRRVTLSKPK